MHTASLRRHPGSRRESPFAAAPTSDSFWTSLAYFSLYRIVLAILFLAASVVPDPSLSLGSENLPLFRAAAGFYLLVGFALYAVLRFAQHGFVLQLSAHVLIDVIVLIFLMHTSGGIRSGIGVMVLVSVTGASLLAPSRFTFLYASIASIGLLFEQGYRFLMSETTSEAFLPPALLAMTCFVVVGATGWLAQRVAANEALARARGRELDRQIRVNQLVIADLQDGILVVDEAARIVQHNPQAGRLLNRENLKGEQIGRVLPGLGDEIDGRSEGDFVAGGRELRWHRMRTGGAETFSILFVEDMTQVREQAQQLKLAALGRLTANIAHEIRNPLSAISHAAELLGEEKHDEDRNRLCRIIADNTRRLDRLVAEVLQLNRRDRATPERIALAGWLQAFVEEFQRNASLPDSQIRLEVEAGIAIFFDREQLHQVMWNLMRNAMRYASSAVGSVRVSVHREAAQVVIDVMDDGPGASSEVQGQLFEPFFTTEPGGMGLGLYLARELCLANRAGLEYRPMSAGACFRVHCAAEAQP